MFSKIGGVVVGTGRAICGRRELAEVEIHNGELDHVLMRPSVMIGLSLT